MPNGPLATVNESQITDEYLAGFIDGEGCITIGRNSRPSYWVHISISNTNRPILEAIQDRFGGTIAGKGEANLKWKPAYALQVTNRDQAEKILTAVYPYLVVRKPQATLALQYIYYMKSIRRQAKCLDSDIQVRERLFQRSRQLNRKGQA